MTHITKIIVMVATVTICTIPLIFTESDEMPLQETVTEYQVKPNNERYKDIITLDQSELQLNHEVIQYKILFYDNATINVNGCVAYVIRKLKPVAYLFCLTDGEKLLVNYSHCLQVPSGTILDITTRSNYFKIGGRIFYRLINIGRKDTFDRVFSVSSGDSWYLTIGVYNSIKNEEISFKMKSSKPCLDLIQLERHKEIGLFSSWDNDFSGIYIGFRILPFLPFGFSFADNLKREITTTRGAIVSFLSVKHLIGKIAVRLPDGSLFINNNRWSAGFFYHGNQTGIWSFKASGIGFPWKHIVLLFYADIDLHIRLSADG